ncbi:uncharacterized protein [Porites lutea]|uniref:uncharacterized protein n=1 Tax=Porites lutea TaxID=51062 RepID=UPI003CC528CF
MKKTKDNLITKLALRETRGNMQPHLRGNRQRFFKKYPQRFCIPLANILDSNGAIKKGHVILGFTKNGRYLVSYSLKIDNDDSSPLLCYVYSLHWWEFNQHKPLVEVFSVTLFDKEEIHQDLHLIVAESQDESTFVVYGQTHSVKDDYDQSHQCYVTVCAGPSPHPCVGCNYASLGRVTDKCLKHSFVVHFKFDLMAPFPMFNPSLSLKMQDTVLFNTGDFLMALKVSATFNKNSSLVTESVDFCGDQQNELFCKVCDKAPDSIAISNQYSAVTEVDRCHAADKDNENQACGGISGTHHSQTHLGEDSSSADSEKTVQGDSSINEIHAGKKQLGRQKVVLGFVRELYEIHGECVNSHQVNDREYLLTPQETFDEKDTKVHSEICSDEANGSLDGQTNQSSNKSESNQLTEKFRSGQTSELSFCSKDETEATKTVCSIVTEVSSRSAVHDSLKDSSLPDTDSKSNYNLDADYSAKMVDSCCCGRNAVVPTTNNNLTLSVLKVYADPDNGDLCELPDRSDEFDMYDGSLAVSVKTCHGKTLKQIGKINQSGLKMAPSKLQYHSKGQTLVVHQMTLDLEQCIGELIQAHDRLRDCYKSLKDYDVQILHVLPDSRRVVIMARILVYTRTREKSTSCGLPVSPSPVLQCTGFIFSWDLCTGGLRILQVLDVEAYSEQKKYGKFNMAAKEARELRAKIFIPQSFSSYVQAFSNHTVFTGKSLKYLKHPFLPLVLVL